VELLIFAGLVWLFAAIANTINDTSEKTTGAIKDKNASSKGRPTHTNKPPKLSTRQKREHRIKNAIRKESLRPPTHETSFKVNPYTMKVYWFENGEPMFQSKPWFREFLIELDEKYRGNLEKKCKDGGEKLSDVIAFIESDPVLLKSVKLIVMKYSERRYEKYFGSINSQANARKRKGGKKGNEERASINDRLSPENKPAQVQPSLRDESISYRALNETIYEVQQLKRAKRYSQAMPLALELVRYHPTEPMAHKSLAKVQALAGVLGPAKESMAMVLMLYQTDLTTAFVDVQYERSITPFFQHLFLEYINAAYYVAEFQKHINSSLPESTKSALLGEALPDITNEATMKRQILSGIRQCNPFWNRTGNEFKQAIENLIESISLK